jgi:predicted phosphodiesterase
LTETALIISDLHVPFHDKKLLQKICRVIVDTRPTHFIINGDFLDLYSLGSYNADSVNKLKDVTLGDEYEAGVEVLKKLEMALPKGTHKHFLYGNHEDRYFRELDRGDRGKYAGALQAPEEALRLRDRGFTVHTNWKQDYVTLGGHLEVTHGIYCPVHVAKRHLDDLQGSVIVGHSHRFQSFVLGKRGAWNVGFLGDMNSKGFHYMARTQRMKWAQGFAFVTIDDNGRFWVEPIQVHDGKFICRGRMY